MERHHEPIRPGDHAPPPHSSTDRRGFVAKLLAVCCGGLATLPPLLAGVWTFLDPLKRRGRGHVPARDRPDERARGRRPRQFAVVADRVDAWTGFAAEPIGAVYLRREPGSDTVEALSATCPHAGCFVEIESQERCFRCPCHNSKFMLDGGIVAPSPSPRAMDGLECRVAKNGEIAVKWQNFYTGIAEKVARP